MKQSKGCWLLAHHTHIDIPHGTSQHPPPPYPYVCRPPFKQPSREGTSSSPAAHHKLSLMYRSWILSPCGLPTPVREPIIYRYVCRLADSCYPEHTGRQAGRQVNYVLPCMTAASSSSRVPKRVNSSVLLGPGRVGLGSLGFGDRRKGYWHPSSLAVSTYISMYIHIHLHMYCVQ